MEDGDKDDDSSKHDMEREEQEILETEENSLTLVMEQSEIRSNSSTGTRNPIHKCFAYDPSTKVSRCLVEKCSMNIKGKWPSNLERHLKSKHPKIFRIFEGEKKAFVTKKESQKSIPVVSSEDDFSTNKKQIDLKCAFELVKRLKETVAKESPQYQECAQAIGKAFLCNSLSQRLIEDRHFCTMLLKCSFGKLATLPNIKELDKIMMKITENLKRNIQISLAATKFVSLTVDLWSRKGNLAGFIGLTAHYFNRDKGELQRVLLGCHRIQHPHSGENIYNKTVEILSEWNISYDHVLRIVTDNGANVVKAFKECVMTLTLMRMQQHHVGQEIQGEDLQLSHETKRMKSSAKFQCDANLDEDVDENDSICDENESIEFETETDDGDEYENEESILNMYFGRKRRISCFAHDMMLVVKKAVNMNNDFSVIQKKVMAVIGFFGHSSKAKELLKMKTGLSLVRPVTTRWIYWYYVLNRLIEVKRGFCDVCDELNIDHDLRQFDWRLIEQFKTCLEPAAKAVQRLEGDRYVTLSEIYPVLFSVYGTLEEIKNHVLTPICDLITDLLDRLRKKFAKITDKCDLQFDPIYIISTFLDPRYSLLIAGNLNEVIYSEFMAMITKSSLLKQTSPTSRRNIESASIDNEHGQENDVLDFARKKIKALRNAQNTDSLQNQSLDHELSYYKSIIKMSVSSSTTTMSECVDPLEFWKTHKQAMPILYNMAVDILSIPATSAPVERVFSIAGFVLARNRHNLSDENLSREVFFKFNVDFA